MQITRFVATILLSATSASNAFMYSKNVASKIAVGSALRNGNRFSASDTTTILLASSPLFFSENNDDFDVEAARRRLEALLSSGGAVAPINDNDVGVVADHHHQEDAEQGGVTATAVADLKQQDEATPPSRDNLIPPHYLYDEDTVDDPYNDLTLPQNPPPPPLTAISRERKFAEIELLKRLDNAGGDDDEDILPQLWTLWFQERGPEAAQRLQHAERLMAAAANDDDDDDLISEDSSVIPLLSSTAIRLDQAELILRELIDEHGMYWVEPVNRLATLYYMKGRLEKAEALCRMVLAAKPWHFGALSGIVMMYAGMRRTKKARQWAAQRLPQDARRRKAWVRKAVRKAEQSLQEAEMRTRLGFGEPDIHAMDADLSLGMEENEWQ